VLNDIEGARREIQRMRQLDGYPRFSGDETAENELVLAACRQASELRHIEQAINRIMSAGEWTRCPLPHELAAAVYAQTPPREFGCKQCGGTGWRIVVRGDLSGAEKCGCRS
jgi:hypothetical protein